MVSTPVAALAPSSQFMYVANSGAIAGKMPDVGEED